METELAQAPDGRALAYCEWGLGDGSPVFLLHGGPGSRLLRHVRGEYERQGIRAITYDRPGYGRSDRREGWRVADSAGDIIAIADQLGFQQFSVVGVSGGGPSALSVAAIHPERVRRCATIVGSAPLDAADLDFFDGMDAEQVTEWRCAQEGPACLAGRFYQETLEWLEDLAEYDFLPVAVRDMLVEAMGEGLLTPWGMVDDYLSHLQPWGFDVADVRCPTKVLIAREDTSVPPAHGHWLVQHIPSAEAVVVDGGHLGPRDAAEEELLGWLGRG